MEGQGKRLLLAVALALGVMFAWNIIFPQKKSEEQQPAVGSGSAVVAGSGSATAPGSNAPVAGAPQQGVPAPVVEPPCTGGETTALTLPEHYIATFTTCGGTLASWKLTDKKFEGDTTKGELLSGKDGFGAFHVGFWGSTFGIPANAQWTKTASTATTVSYVLDAAPLHVEKTFEIFPNYLVKLTVKYAVTVPAGQVAKQRLSVSTYEFQDPKANTSSKMQVAARVWVSSTYRDGGIAHTSFKNVLKASRHEIGVKWAGFEHPYLLAIFAPRHEQAEVLEKFTRAVDGTEGLVKTSLVYPELVFEAGKGKTDTREIAAYLGPKAYKNLDAADETVGFATKFTGTVDFGWFGFIGRPLLWLLLKFQSVLVNWGLAIVMLTLLVKAATIYWTTKSMRSMKAMAALAPQMKELQKKYEGDRQRLQVETMALYKQHKVNPIAGCLPMFLQMPIWIALYRMLSNAGELYRAPFIGGWIDDLTATDPYHILPVVLVVTMFMQARLTPATSDSRQQKFLQYGMPLMFGVMSFFFPAGLTLYIFTNTCLSALHSIYMNKFDKKSLEIMARMKANTEAATAAAADAAKPAGSDGDPSKPGTAVSPPRKGPSQRNRNTAKKRR